MQRIKSMSRARRRITTGAIVLGAAFMGMGGYAFAQWILNTGVSSSANSPTTASTIFNVTVNANPTGGAMNQGGVETETWSIANSSTTTQPIDIADITTSIASDSNGLGGTGVNNGAGGIYNPVTSAYVDTCPASNFTLGTITPIAGGMEMSTTPTTTVTLNTSGPSAFTLFTVTITTSATAPTACEGQSIQTVVSAI